MTHTLCCVGQDDDDNNRGTIRWHDHSLDTAVADRTLDWIEVAECAVQSSEFLAV